MILSEEAFNMIQSQLARAIARAEKAEAALADERELVEQLMDADPSTRDWVAKARTLRDANDDGHLDEQDVYEGEG